MAEGKVRVLVVDDHAVFREGTRHILNAEEDIEVVGEAADGRQAVELTVALKPDVVLLDMAMPGMTGVEATRQIKAVSPGTSVLVLSAYDDDQYVFAVLEVGAAGYLLKSARGAEVVEATRAVRRGESVLHPAITRKVLQRIMQRGASPPSPSTRKDVLTAREQELLRAAASGASNKAIAHSLGVSDRTVQAHLAHIFSKLDVGSRTEAVTKAIREGLISLEDLD